MTSRQSYKCMYCISKTLYDKLIEQSSLKATNKNISNTYVSSLQRHDIEDVNGLYKNRPSIVSPPPPPSPSPSPSSFPMTQVPSQTKINSFPSDPVSQVPVQAKVESVNHNTFTRPAISSTSVSSSQPLQSLPLVSRVPVQVKVKSANRNAFIHPAITTTSVSSSQPLQSLPLNQDVVHTPIAATSSIQSLPRNAIKHIPITSITEADPPIAGTSTPRNAIKVLPVQNEQSLMPPNTIEFSPVLNEFLHSDLASSLSLPISSAPSYRKDKGKQIRKATYSFSPYSTKTKPTRNENPNVSQLKEAISGVFTKPIYRSNRPQIEPPKESFSPYSTETKPTRNENPNVSQLEEAISSVFTKPIYRSNRLQIEPPKETDKPLMIEYKTDSNKKSSPLMIVDKSGPEYSKDYDVIASTSLSDKSEPEYDTTSASSTIEDKQEKEKEREELEKVVSKKIKNIYRGKNPWFRKKPYEKRKKEKEKYYVQHLPISTPSTKKYKDVKEEGSKKVRFNTRKRFFPVDEVEAKVRLSKNKDLKKKKSKIVNPRKRVFPVDEVEAKVRISKNKDIEKKKSRFIT